MDEILWRARAAMNACLESSMLLGRVEVATCLCSLVAGSGVIAGVRRSGRSRTI